MRADAVGRKRQQQPACLRLGRLRRNGFGKVVGMVAQLLAAVAVSAQDACLYRPHHFVLLRLPPLCNARVRGGGTLGIGSTRLPEPYLLLQARLGTELRAGGLLGRRRRHLTVLAQSAGIVVQHPLALCRTRRQQAA